MPQTPRKFSQLLGISLEGDAVNVPSIIGSVLRKTHIVSPNASVQISLHGDPNIQTVPDSKRSSDINKEVSQKVRRTSVYLQVELATEISERAFPTTNDPVYISGTDECLPINIGALVDLWFGRPGRIGTLLRHRPDVLTGKDFHISQGQPNNLSTASDKRVLGLVLLVEGYP
ncbi:hypothetical protein G7046_g8273 [Stylonectria norvegica]|nr:hypothetical protein G7046_g8273 [Stylonectria norvegica]